MKPLRLTAGLAGFVPRAAVDLPLLWHAGNYGDRLELSVFLQGAGADVRGPHTGRPIENQRTCYVVQGAYSGNFSLDLDTQTAALAATLAATLAPQGVFVFYGLAKQITDIGTLGAFQLLGAADLSLVDPGEYRGGDTFAVVLDQSGFYQDLMYDFDADAALCATAATRYSRFGGQYLSIYDPLAPGGSDESDFLSANIGTLADLGISLEVIPVAAPDITTGDLEALVVPAAVAFFS